MATEIGVVAAVGGIVGVNIIELIDKGIALQKQLKDVKSDFKDSCEHLSKSVDILLQTLQEYRKLDEDGAIQFQNIIEDEDEHWKPKYTAVGLAAKQISVRASMRLMST